MENAIVLFYAYLYLYIEEGDQVLDRLKMELSNQECFTEEQYIQFLTENNLSSIEKLK